MTIALPTSPIIGPVALKEAAAGEFRAVVRIVSEAVRTSINGTRPAHECEYIAIEAIYPDRVVIEHKGRLYAYPYTLGDDNQVSLGEPEEVVLDHRSVAMREAQQVFIEAQDEKGLKWRVRIIQAGLSGNRNYYPDVVLREAASLFEGVRVFVKSDEEHLAGKGKSFHNLIGRITGATFVEGRGKDKGQIEGVLELLSSSGEVPTKLTEAWQRNMAGDLFGFSIDASGTAKVEKGRRIAKQITKVNSVDLIIEPGAGGQILNLIEAISPEATADMKLRERMIEAVKKANKGALPEGLDVDDDEALETAYREALAQDTHDDAKQAKAPEAESAASGQGVTRDELDQRMRMVEARSHLRAAVAESGLPDFARDRIHKQFDGLDSFTEAQVDDAIKAEREYLGKVGGGGQVKNLGDASFIEAGEDRADKITKMLDAFFDPANRDVISFKECYVEITGDRRVTGDLKQCDPVRLREAQGDSPFRESIDTTVFSNVLGEAMARRLLADYNTPNQYDIWRDLASVVPVNDFRTQERTRFGGYGDLPTVAQKAAYTALSSPDDEKATYAVSKRGGTEDVSLEAIRNDDVGAIQRIPIKLSRAAKRTLGKFVLDFIRTNPTIYDSVALFHASHNNLGATALGASSLAAARLAMLQQTEAGSSDRLGIPAKHLWVPSDLEEGAFNLFRRSTNNDTDFIESMQMMVHPVWYWTDANDWAISADKDEIPTIEIGFLDGNEEPEIFVQDSPTQGSLFSNDLITYKIRHIYGGNVLDFRGLYKAVVA